MAMMTDLAAMGCDGTSSSALENSHQVSTKQSILYGFDGRNTDTSNVIYVMVFDKATTPVSGTDVPIIVVAANENSATTPGNGNFGYTIPGAFGRKIVNGIFIAACTGDFNGSTFTITSSNKTFFHVQWTPEDGLTNP